jgi:hypothetical protein
MMTTPLCLPLSDHANTILFSLENPPSVPFVAQIPWDDRPMIEERKIERKTKIKEKAEETNGVTLDPKVSPYIGTLPFLS